MRKLLRVLLRAALRVPGLGAVRTLARRLPTSRFARWVPRVFGGAERTRWRDVDVKVDVGDYAGFYLYFFGDYEAHEVDKAIELCRKARTFIDAGAHVGLVALPVARACPQLRVIAFEPDPVLARRFRENLAMNTGLEERVELVEAALATHDGWARFRRSTSETNSADGRLTGDSSEGGTIRVRAMTLEGFLQRRQLHADVIKIDVEGAEIPILESASRHEPTFAVLLETHGSLHEPDAVQHNASVAALLARAGFAVERFVGGRWLPLTEPADLGARSHVVALRRRPSTGPRDEAGMRLPEALV